MKPVSFLFTFVVLVCTITKGKALKCYSSQCSKQVGPGVQSGGCSKLEEITCKPMLGQLTDPDRCSYYKIVQTMKQLNMTITITQEVKNCSYSYMCSKQCAAVPVGAKCYVKCCEGNLCNDGSNKTGPTQAPKPKPTGPVGKDLSCYACGSEQGSPEDSKCVKPTKRTCGTDQMGTPESMCRTVITKVKSPDGKIHDSEMRNCSSAYFCNEKFICSSMNMTGIIKECKVSCCEGNLCNKDADEVPSASISTMASNILVFLLSLGLIARF